MTGAPTLTTDRLVLRGPQAQDFEAHASFFADKERSWGFGGPENRNGAWRWFASNIGHWALRGYGYWTITDSKTNAIYGITGLWHPEGWPEAELGWVAFEGAEGKGIIHEAATAARAYAFAHLGITKLPSYIMPGNTRSIALATRMGATYETTFENVSHGTELIYRHPTPEQL
ncbi:MAG: GNAT family N-acetyltransferase [Paracoccaceae bacterium]